MEMSDREIITHIVSLQKENANLSEEVVSLRNSTTSLLNQLDGERNRVAEGMDRKTLYGTNIFLEDVLLLLKEIGRNTETYSHGTGGKSEPRYVSSLKIPLIKALRLKKDIGLKEAKDIVEALTGL